jgi:E3 ubiquitin-protein ligase RFWD2
MVLFHLILAPEVFSNFTKDHKNFFSTLLRSSNYSKFTPVASLHYADNLYNFSSSIVSSIEFDRDDEYFASAGVTKKIKLFDFASVVAGTSFSSNFITKTRFQGLDSESSDDEQLFSAPKYPIKEMSCNSKIRFRIA